MELLTFAVGERGGVRGRGIPSREGAEAVHSDTHKHTHVPVKDARTRWMCCRRRKAFRADRRGELQCVHVWSLRHVYVLAELTARFPLGRKGSTMTD